MSEEKTQVSIRIPSSLLSELDRIAEALDRDRTWVMLHCFRQYLSNEGAEILADSESIAALDRGEGVDLVDVLKEADAILEAARQKLARKRA